MDTNTLATLPDRELASGISEIVKYGLIRWVGGWVGGWVRGAGERAGPAWRLHRDAWAVDGVAAATASTLKNAPPPPPPLPSPARAQGCPPV